MLTDHGKSTKRFDTASPQNGFVQNSPDAGASRTFADVVKEIDEDPPNKKTKLNENEIVEMLRVQGAGVQAAANAAEQAATAVANMMQMLVPLLTGQQPTITQGAATTQGMEPRATAQPVVDQAREVPATVPDNEIRAEADKALMAARKKHIDLVAKKFATTVDKFVKSQTLVESLSAQIKVLENHELLRYPPGTRPYKSPSTIVELDLPLKGAMQGPMDFKVTFPKLCSRSEALRQLHHYVLHCQKTIYLEAVEDHVADLKKKASRTAFIETAMDESSIGTYSEADKLNLDDPQRKAISIQKLRKMAEERYAAIVDAQRRKKQELAEKKRKEEADKRKDEEIFASKPENLIQDLVQATVKSELAGSTGNREAISTEEHQQGQDASAATNVQQTASTLISSLAKAASSKNGAPPSAVAGDCTHKDARKPGTSNRTRERKTNWPRSKSHHANAHWYQSWGNWNSWSPAGRNRKERSGGWRKDKQGVRFGGKRRGS